MEYLCDRQYTSHKRYVKTLMLNDDSQLIKEYKEAHAAGAAWPEITQGMIDVGILDMEIYIVGTRLIMIMDTLADFDHEKDMSTLATKPRQSEWEKAMAKFQRSSSDASADEKWQLLERIYKLGD